MPRASDGRLSAACYAAVKNTGIYVLRGAQQRCSSAWKGRAVAMHVPLSVLASAMLTVDWSQFHSHCSLGVGPVL